MSSQTKVQKVAHKSEWVKPSVRRLETRDAQSSHGALPDGDGGNQGS
jgi:hypothetical protein